MLNRRLIITFSLLYAGLRVFSYFWGPSTPLQSPHPLNTIVTLAILALAAYWFTKADNRAWYLIALEFIVGGSGNYLEAFGISLRTWLLLVSAIAFGSCLLINQHYKLWWKNEWRMITIFGALYLVVALGSINGYYNHHNTKLIFADAVPYLFLFYYFPLRELWNNNVFKSLAQNALVVAVIGNTLFMLGTLAGFSSGLLALQDGYYHWFRDVASGKITELGHFYRLVVNEHLLLVPIMLYSLYQVIKKQQTALFITLTTATTIILAMNLTRIYMVALFVGYWLLFSKMYWRRWLMVGVGLAALFVTSFSLLHLAASRGTSFGWELFGLRLGSIVAPQIEDSSLSRLLLLPKIIEKIKTHPFTGAGLGDTVTVYSPVLDKIVTTPSYDWGYLEIIGELGIIGLFIWLKLLQAIWKPLQWATWPLATFGALLVTTITSPALFHVLGIIWLAILLQNKK